MGTTNALHPPPCESTCIPRRFTRAGQRTVYVHDQAVVSPLVRASMVGTGVPMARALSASSGNAFT